MHNIARQHEARFTWGVGLIPASEDSIEASAAADDALRLADIDRALDAALSGDSEAFLRASRQEGGQ
jgi:hypothetical protein